MTDTIRTWLEQLGLGEYAEAFIENEVGVDMLDQLSNEDLKDLGVAKLGHRKKILSAIEGAGAEGADDPARVDTAPAPPGPRAERRQLTVMFCDLVGSTDLSARLDPEELREAITGFQTLVGDAVARFDGQVAKFMGDGVLCYFGWPRAHEEDAQRAVRAGLAIMKSMHQATGPGAIRLEARIGIATGLVVVGDLIGSGSAQEEAAVGETLNVAARLQGIAEPGQIVVGDATRMLLGQSFFVTDLGPKTLKGIPEKMRAFAVEGEKPVESRFEAQISGSLAPMVGREHELNLIRDRGHQAWAGNGQIVVLTGGPGIGKSRVTRAMLDATDAARHTRITYQCSPIYEGTPLYPAIQQITRAAGIREGDATEVQLDKLEALLQRSSVPLVAALLGLDARARYGPLNLSPTQQRADTFDVLVSELVALSRDRPVLFLVEDAHWIDATTLELIDATADRIAAERVFMLVTARSGFEHSFAGRTAVTRLELNRLGRPQIEAIIDEVAGETVLPDEICEAIVARSDGVPLFAEELTKTMIAARAGGPAGSGYAPRGARAVHDVPASLSDSLMSRLDRSQAAKEVAQIAASIGREFSFGLLEQIVDFPPGMLEEGLAELCAAELVFRRGADSDRSYLFKHALVSDAAYQSLLLSRRKDIHARIADVLSRIAETAPEVIARHLAGAGRPDEAAAAWERAANSALERAAQREAAQHFHAALDQLELLPDSHERQLREVRILTRLGSTILNTEGWASVEANRVHLRAKELAEGLGTSPERVSALVGIWLYHTGRGEHGSAAEMTKDLDRIARKSGDAGLMLQAHHAAWPNHVVLGELPECVSAIEAGLALYDEEAHSDHKHLYMGHDPAVCAHSICSMAKWALGNIAEAYEHSDSAVALCRSNGHTASLIHSLMVQGPWLCTVEEGQRLLDLAEELDSLATLHHLPAAGVNARIFRGWGLVRLGEVARGLEDLETGVAAWKGSGARIFLAQRLSLLGGAQSRLGRHDDALGTMQQAVKYLAQTKERQFAPEIHQRHGDALLAADAGNLALAEQAYGKAEAEAARLGATSYILRSALALGRLQADRGNAGAAARGLRAALDRFPKGETIPELAEARALAETLGAG